MITIMSALLSVLSFRFRRRASLELELVALRHQLAVLRRQRPRSASDLRNRPTALDVALPDFPVRELRPSAAARRNSPLRLEIFVRAATGGPHRRSWRAAAGRKPDAPRRPGM